MSNSTIPRLGSVWPCWLLLTLALFATGVGAKEAAPASVDPALEARVMAIGAELRCLVCQNQTIADSDAELAVDLRQQIRVKLAAGQSQREIQDYMVARYGDFVLYRPRLSAKTVLLWIGPFALLFGGGFVMLRNIRQRRRATQADKWTPEQERQARSLLDEDGAKP